MRTAQKVLRATIIALAALAFSATTASATGISVSEHGFPCDDVVVNDHAVSGGCASHVTSEGVVEFGVQIPFFGYVHQYTCNNEYTLRFDADGEGAITDLNFSGCATSTTECAEAQAHGGGSATWPAHAEESGAGELAFTAIVCIQLGAGARCEGPLNLELQDTSAPGQNLELQSDPRAPIGASVCRITGHWLVENSSLTITH
jgi:hypothetical protein